MTFGLTKRNNVGSELDFFRRSISSVFDDFFDTGCGGMLQTEWGPALDVDEDKREYISRLISKRAFS